MAEGRIAPAFIEPQLAKLAQAAPAGNDWIHEIKFDGYRMQIRVEKRNVTIRTRGGHDWTDRFPLLVKAARRLPNCIIDGELCAFDKDGQPDFAQLVAALKEDTGPLVFLAFDILWLGREDIRRRGQLDRKLVLASVLERTAAPIHFSTHSTGSGPAVFKAVAKRGIEGIISKRANATYRSGKGDNWLKIKSRPGMEVVIGGWTQTKSGGFHSLLVGVHEGGRLRYAGKVGTGFSQRVLEDLLPELEALERRMSPFTGRQPTSGESMRYVAPELVAEIAFATWTRDDLLRQASFKALRADKPAQSVEREEIRS